MNVSGEIALIYEWCTKNQFEFDVLTNSPTERKKIRKQSTVGKSCAMKNSIGTRPKITRLRKM